MEDVDSALEQCEDSSRHMAVYQGGDKLIQRVREHCFTKDGKPLRPHKLDDFLKKLHLRLGCHTLHSIPVGFYYAKWSEKLHFNLAKRISKERRQERSLSSTSRSRTPTPSPAPERSPSPPTKSSNVAPLSAAVDTSMDEMVPMTIAYAEGKFDELRLIRAAIFNDKPDAQLTKKDKDVFWYREKRRRQWKLAKDETMMNETH
jgi:hypothetical protein